jgi:hypothetical protein
MFEMIVGHGESICAERALEDAIAQCREGLGGSEPDAGIFYTSFLDDDCGPMTRAVLHAFPGIELVGCTTDGELSNSGYRERSMLLVLFRSDEVRFASGLGRGYGEDPEGATRRAVDEARAKLPGEPALCIAMPDGLTSIGAPVVESLRAALGTVPVFGGTAGDRFRLERTWQFAGREAVTDGVALMLMEGPLRFSSGVRSGWTPVGRRQRVRGVSGNLVRRIGERTAMDFYHHYIGDNESAFVQFPLAVYPDGSEDFFLRDPLVFHPEDGSISFVGTFPGECEVQLAEAGREEIIEAARAATHAAIKAYPGERPVAALVFSCCSRHIILGSRTGEEQTLAKGALGGLPLAGFYTYGELAPLAPGARCSYHNDTFVLLLLGTQ